MERKDFGFELPEHLIAQTPLENREESRLMTIDKVTGELGHHHFYELPKILRPGDCLVLNDSRVIPARLLGKRDTGGAVEVVLLHEVPGAGAEQGSGDTIRWECLTRPGKKTMPGTKLIFGGGELTGTVIGTGDGGNKIIEFNFDGIFMEVLESLGKMPLPPYIHEELIDAERYQTVYSKESGSAAAPTAGLHFTHELLDEVRAAGVEVCYLTLHVGLGTFRPVKAEKIEDHEMHSESYSISKETADIINRTKKNGGRVVAVGTTSCRTLESIAHENGQVPHGSGDTSIFIYPGYKFKCMDGLITNFHLPESTLIMLVSAFAGKDNILHAYETAVKEEYRFFSFGDAMLIV
ncbi:MAG: tRNA preQ1(34) S-adenosylmethionine ribosyltransferase-isomerase QueA [Oscillospiraceae bacterium]|nr:tRNA preQ1(34) S-adenosylmethionine ribosyltransferase-isomerase QueA [Oscillospiraceae bacterium]MCL2249935.1 tRNA preQ1(34) S-adenosylmethionine ribosyltransferase-isomerase QueA [Oscillospiraceae bacterium]